MMQHLTDRVQLWAPEYKRGMDMQDTFQGRTMKMIKGLEYICYDKRLRLFSLEARSLRGRSHQNTPEMSVQRRCGQALSSGDQ